MMTELSPELHHHDAEFDDVSPEEFMASFSVLDEQSQIERALHLEDRFRAFGKLSIEHLQQAALGVQADQYRLSPESRERRKRMGDALLQRESTIEQIEALLVIALQTPSVKLALEQANKSRVTRARS